VNGAATRPLIRELIVRLGPEGTDSPFSVPALCDPLALPDLRAVHQAELLMVKAVIFDLDSCLAAANEVGEALFAHAFQAIRCANNGHIPNERLEAAFKDCWRFPFDFIADKYGFSVAMRSAGFAAFSQTEVTRPMQGYGDLDALREISAKLFLVTSGFRRLQQSKVRALGIEHLLTELHIDALDESGPKGKLHAFQSILRNHQLSPAEILVVGDNPESEIAAGNQLGMTTIQILRPGVPPSPAATHQIRSLHELKRFISEG
jgi:putative hydrolase of the HAD superfamily